MRMMVQTGAVIALIVTTGAAQAAPVSAGSGFSFSSYVQAIGSTTLDMATGLDFVGASRVSSPGVSGALTSYGSGTGVFAGIGCSGGACGTISDISALTLGTQNITDFATLLGAGGPITFSLTDIASIDRSHSNSLTLFAAGVINYAGYDATVAQFRLSVQGDTLVSISGWAQGSTSVGDSTAVNVIPGSVQVATLPEPASLALLGSAIAFAGLVRRERKQV